MFTLEDPVEQWATPSVFMNSPQGGCLLLGQVEPREAEHSELRRAGRAQWTAGAQGGQRGGVAGGGPSQHWDLAGGHGKGRSIGWSGGCM